jgi:tRNA (guanine37-N1)-methyltransferase
VPAALRGGNHAEVARWRLRQSLARTRARRPDLLDQRALSPLELELLDESLDELEQTRGQDEVQ